LISNQQQGVELYACARKFMDVDELYREVEKEISTSHEYLDQQQQRKQSDITTLLTVVATFGLAISTALAFLALDSESKSAALQRFNIARLTIPVWLFVAILSLLLFFLLVFSSRLWAAILNWLASRPTAILGWLKSIYLKISGKSKK